MGVAFAKNRYEAKYIPLHSKAFAIGLNQALRGQLRRPIKRSLDWERTSFWRRENLRLAISRSRGRKHDALAPPLAHSLQHIPGRDRILIQVFSRMLGTKAHIGVGGKMHHQFRALHNLQQTLSLEQIAPIKTKTRIAASLFQKMLLPGRHIIEANHLMAGGQKTVDHVAANKSCCSRNQNAQ